MTALLVSVRDRHEAALAVAGGADLIDLKQPAAGSLGAVEAPTMDEVARWLAARKPMSVALGELRALDFDLPARVPPQTSYAKLGLAGCAALPGWQADWRRACDRLPRSVAPVAVVYADWRTAAAPSPEQVLRAALGVGAAVVLIDTCSKADGGLFDYWPADSLGKFTAAVRGERLKLVLAGSLSFDTLPAALQLEPDYIAVRGAVCHSSRTGMLDPELVAKMRAAVYGKSRPRRLASLSPDG